MIRRFRPISAFCLLLALAVVWAPLPFGSVVPWAETLLQLLVFALAGCGLLAAGGAGWRAVRWPALGLVGLALLGALQAIPWPRGVAAALSPELLRLADARAALLAQPVPAHLALSLAPWASTSAALAFAAVAAALVAAAALANDCAGPQGRTGRGGRRMLGAAVLLAGVVEAFVGAQLWLARSRTIWGVEVQAPTWRLHGTFVNPDHLAAFLEVALAVAFAWGWWGWRRGRGDERMDVRLLLAGPPALVWLLLFLVLSFTGSRAGLLAAVAGVAAQAALLALERRRLAPVLAGAAVLALGVAAIAWIGLREGLGRLTSTSMADVSLGARQQLAAQSLGLWLRFPLLGAGLGTFPEAFPLVQQATLSGATWTHAHNDPVELLATGGVVALVCAAFAAVFMARRLLDGWWRGARSEDRAAALAGLGALASVGLHELLDFGLTMPANAFVLAVVCGAGSVVRRTAESA